MHAEPRDVEPCAFEPQGESVGPSLRGMLFCDQGGGPLVLPSLWECGAGARGSDSLTRRH